MHHDHASSSQRKESVDAQKRFISPEKGKGQLSSGQYKTDPEAEPAGYESDDEEDLQPPATAVAKGGEPEKGRQEDLPDRLRAYDDDCADPEEKKGNTQGAQQLVEVHFLGRGRSVLVPVRGAWE
eukprot:1157528-Pelagomonas_calceolata.AAC.3